MAEFISIICPVYNEERYIAGCIDSVLASDWPRENMELLLVDGGSSDHTREIIADYIEKHPFVRLLDNPEKIVPTAMNIGIKAAKGGIIMRIDAHSVYPAGYVSTLARKKRELKADNTGTPIRTLPADNSVKSTSIAVTSSHPFGVGDSRFRTGSDTVREVDTVPFGCFDKALFDRIGMYDEEMILNEDDELNGRIIRNGGKILLIPDVVIDYTARPTIGKMAHMYWGYGLFKPLVNKKLGRAATWRQFVPPLFVAGLAVGAALSFAFRWLFYIYICVVAAYILAAVSISVGEAFRHRTWKLALILPWTFFVAHVSYGTGYWAGLFTVMSGRIPKFKSKR